MQKKVRGWLRSGIVVAVWIATPCGSFSKARNQPGGPPALRDTCFPEGLPNLRPADALKVAVGNRIGKFSFSLFGLDRALNIPVVLENPATSWLWSQRYATAMAKLTDVKDIEFDFCASVCP